MRGSGGVEPKATFLAEPFTIDPTEFPHLSWDDAAPSSDATSAYNCFAWAAGDTQRWWSHRRYWPPEAPRAHTREAYQAAFEVLGYTPCGSGEFEEGYEKVAVFADRLGRPQHAARQLADGRWTSKLGDDIDIIHSSLNDVAGGIYGEPVIFLRRAVQQDDPQTLLH